MCLSFDSDTDDEDEGYLRSSSEDGDLMSKQKRLKKLSASKPGSLLARGFGLMHEQLGTLFGDKGSGGSHEDLLQPAALRYLLSSALPLMDLKKVGEEKMRELRTLATSLDYLVAGMVGQSGDIQMQRMKSILMGIKDGSTTVSRYLELVPIGLYPTAATIEEAYSRGLAVQHVKSEKLLERVQGHKVQGLGGVLTCLLPSAPPQTTDSERRSWGTPSSSSSESQQEAEEPKPQQEPFREESPVRSKGEGNPRAEGGCTARADAYEGGQGCRAAERGGNRLSMEVPGVPEQEEDGGVSGQGTEEERTPVLAGEQAPDGWRRR